MEVDSIYTKITKLGPAQDLIYELDRLTRVN